MKSSMTSGPIILSNQSMAQYVSEVLYRLYEPISEQARAFVIGKQKYFHAILEAKVFHSP
jgi:hypothetical protein